jgi:hypothetical protein
LGFKKGLITKVDIEKGLTSLNVSYTNEEVDQLMSHLKFKDNTSDSISELELYSNAHLYRIDPEERLPIYKRIALACGLDEEIYKHVEVFSERVVHMSDLAFQLNCKLYVDGEQTYLKEGIDLFGRQLA